MSQYVVDTSVMIQHFISEAHTANADELLEEAGKTITLYIPEFCLVECANVLWKHVRFHGVSQSEAEVLVSDIAELDVVVMPAAGLLPRALAIGLKHKLALYDSIYIALAEQLNYPLVTDDAKQAAAALAEGITLKPLTDFNPV
jgi:predicted nucleic acid-binding protein